MVNIFVRVCSLKEGILIMIGYGILKINIEFFILIIFIMRVFNV